MRTTIILSTTKTEIRLILTFRNLSGQTDIDFQEFEWTNGRQLKSITYHFTDGTSKKGLEYTYDENGLRTSKNFGIYKYDYIYDGDKLIAELKTDPDNGNYLDRKEYFYDGNDEVIGFTRRNGQDTYFYLKDAEGNIIGFTDSNGNILGLYDYDAWGKVSHRYSASWENPLTYRGYYYDDENMVYYLQSRYYNPQWGRFLNADIPEIAQQSKGKINGLNLFAYCCNNPVNYSDPTGMIAVTTFLIIGAVAGVVIGGAAGYALSRILKVPKAKRWKYVVGGAVIGAVIGACVGYAVGVAAGGSSGIVLWSGGGMKGAGGTAANFASKNGLRTLEMTRRGKLLSVMNKAATKILGSNKGYKLMKPLWEAGSKQFVKSVVGKQTYVHVFIKVSVFSNESVFARIEYQIIRETGMRIIWHFIK